MNLSLGSGQTSANEQYKNSIPIMSFLLEIFRAALCYIVTVSRFGRKVITGKLGFSQIR